MASRVVVINPNSTERITEQIREAVAGLSDDLRVVTSPGGPAAIETDHDVAASVGPMLETAAGNSEADAYVVACFSDPGLDQLRDSSDAPVFGIAESAVRAAARLADRVGIVSSVDESIPRHDRYWMRLGLDQAVVGDIAVGLGVLELEGEEAYRRVEVAGRALVEAGAGAVVPGCTGMTHMQDRLQNSLGVPVVDPCRAAVTAALEVVGGTPAGRAQR